MVPSWVYYGVYYSFLPPPWVYNGVYYSFLLPYPGGNSVYYSPSSRTRVVTVCTTLSLLLYPGVNRVEHSLPLPVPGCVTVVNPSSCFPW